LKIENWRKVTFRLFCVLISPSLALSISLGQPLINWQQDKSNLDNSSVRFHPFEIYNYRPYDSPSELLSLRINFPDNANRESKMKSIKSINPLLLSLTLSHGSGLYALNQPEKAKRFLYANILFTDIPMVLMIGGILMNKICPEVFQGTVLTVTEYFVNLCVISFYLSIPTIRIFECRSVWKIRDASK
jgi:hypothetical protein